MRAAPLVLAVTLGVTPTAAQDIDSDGSPLTLAAYVAALDTLRGDLEAGRLEAARAAAGALKEQEVVWDGGALAPDTPLLVDVAEVRSVAQAGSQAARLRRLVSALDSAVGGRAPVETDGEVLARVLPRSEIQKGGEAPRLRLEPLSFSDWIGNALDEFMNWLGDIVKKILEWLERFWPRRAGAAEGDTGMTATVAIAFAAVVGALLVVLAIRSLRRSRRPADEGVSTLVRSSARDEDPLSRQTSEWEVYARELAGQRRWREAIRAWYHAVLVALFQSGQLHHQTGRTNWEYVSQLSPRLPWRPGFVSLTRRFDREWYGRRTSDGAALSECAREAQGLLRSVRDRGAP